MRLINKFALGASLGCGAVIAAGVGFGLYGFLLYFASSWFEFFLSAVGVSYDARGRIVAPFLTPEAWLYYAPGAAALLYVIGIAIFCSVRSLRSLHRNRPRPTR